MSNILSASKVDNYIDILQSLNNRISLDEQSLVYLDELFSLLKRIEPVHKNGARELWFCVDRGPLEDFGDLEDMLENEVVENEEEWEGWWLAEYPDETVWFDFGAVENSETGYRSIFLKNKLVIEIDPRRDCGWKYDVSEFVLWLLESLKECIVAIENGSYYEIIQREVPVRRRFGKILRKDYWDICPEERDSFLANISPEDVREFIWKAKGQSERPLGRLDTMTANDFYRFCALGYAANNYDGAELPPKEQYYLHADGRDEGLGKIDPDSPEAFYDWLMHRERGGHPWEICRGGNSTHIDLFVGHDKLGYYLCVAGACVGCTVEAAKIYLALSRAGLPVIIRQGILLAERFEETEWIGIVPDTMLPFYCEHYFPKDNIITFMNLPYENGDRVAEKVCWRPLMPAKLIQANGTTEAE